MRLSRLALLVIASLSGCTDFGDPYIPPRILLGVGIDGVRIGDSREQAWKVLGRPDGGGFYDGILGGGQADMWQKGPHAGVSVYYSEYFTPTSVEIGPIDMVAASGSFSGATDKGIGINSHLNSVLQSYRDYSYSFFDTTGGVLGYCLNGKYCFFSFNDSVVSIISLGYYNPPRPGQLPFYCKPSP